MSKAIGHNLKTIRINMNLSQINFCSYLNKALKQDNLSISANTLAMIERYNHIPRQELVDSLYRIFNEYFLTPKHLTHHKLKPLKLLKTIKREDP